jgi:23S rRNA pseudouridine2605 synthase
MNRPKKRGAPDKKRGGGFKPRAAKQAPIIKDESEGVRLNKFLSNAGICSRREADVIISTGLVSVNNKVVTELGVKVMPEDSVRYDGSLIKREKQQYILVNKPKNTLAVLRDPQHRKTVLRIIKGACKEQVFPVGRLERDELGLLLMTNDSDLAKKLVHPKHPIPQLFHVQTVRKVRQEDLDKMMKGFKIDETFVKVKEAAFVDGNLRQIGVLIHSGKNKNVARIFSHLNYDIARLDRVMFANLTKKDLPRGEWRFLTDKEVAFLKMLQ